MTKCKLGELLEVTRGVSLSGAHYASSGEKLRLTLANFDYVNNCFKLDEGKDDLYYTKEVSAKFVLKKGEIITPLTEQTPGLLGSTARIPESGKFIQSQDVGLIRPFADKLDHDFAYYLVSSRGVREQLGVRSQQTKIRHTSPDKIKDCTVYVPELRDQQKIGRFLSSIDRLIQLSRKRIENLENLAKEIYNYWFVQFDFPDKNGKPYKSTGGKMVYNSQLKRVIPDGWEVVNVGEVMDVNQNSYTENTLPSHISYIDISSVSQGVITGKTRYQKSDAPGRARRMVKDGDVIWSSVRPNLRAYALILSPEIDDVASTGFVVLTPKSVPYGYLYELTTDASYVAFLVNRTGNSAYPAVLPEAFGDFKIALPPEKMLCSYHKIVDPLYRARNSAFTGIDKLAQLREFLLPLLMNGQAKMEGAAV